MTTISITPCPAGYILAVASDSGNYAEVLPSADLAALSLAEEIKLAGDDCHYYAPVEVLARMASKGYGRRLSYYATAEAIEAIEAERTASGISTSGAINRLVTR